MDDDTIMILVLLASLGSLYLAWRQYVTVRKFSDSLTGTMAGGFFGLLQEKMFGTPGTPGAPIGE